MRFFALETDLNVLKRKFLVEGEEAALVTHRHYLAFLVHAFWPVVGGVVVAAGLMGATAVGLLTFDWYILSLAAFFAVEAMLLFHAWSQWKYNFLIVTTQKVVIVEQRTFHQHIHPLPFSSVSNTRVESQFAGIFRCGVLYINTTVPERGGQYQELPIPYMPKPENIAAVIENGLVLTKQPPKPEEEEKRDKMQEPAVEPANPHPETIGEPMPQTAAPPPGALPQS